MQARYYDPLIGRFLSIDPVGFSPDMPFMFGRYTYVGNDPVNGIDPDGRILGKAIKFIRNTIKAGGNPLKGGKDTIAGAAEDIGTLVDGQLNADDAAAVVSLVTGLDKKDQAAIGAGAKRIRVSRSRSPESARHLEESGATGRTLTVDRAGRDQRRRDNMRGRQTQSGMDRDESPPAVFRESENGSVRNIPSSDNRSSGAQIGNQIRDVPDGGCIVIDICG